jgi:hypothetical protein
MMRFNVVNFVVSIVVGWFVMAFLQVVFLSLMSKSWADLMVRFWNIALFRDGTGAVINAVLMVVLGAIGIGIWLLCKGK